MKKLIIFLLCLAIICTSGYFGMQKYKKSKDDKKIVDVVPVSLMAETADMFTYTENEVSGTIVSANAQKIYVDSDKLIKDVKVSEGQQVKKGDVILEYDMTVVELELSQKENKVKVIEQNIKMANKELEQIKAFKPSEDAPQQPQQDYQEPWQEEYEEPEEEYYEEPEETQEPEITEPEQIEPEETSVPESPAQPEAEPVKEPETVPEQEPEKEPEKEPEEEQIKTISLVKAGTVPVSGTGSKKDPFVINASLDAIVMDNFLNKLSHTKQYAVINVYNSDSKLVFKRVIDPEKLVTGSLKSFKITDGLIIDSEEGTICADEGSTAPGRFIFPLAEEKKQEDSQSDVSDVSDDSSSKADDNSLAPKADDSSLSDDNSQESDDSQFEKDALEGLNSEPEIIDEGDEDEVFEDQENFEDYDDYEDFDDPSEWENGSSVDPSDGEYVYTRAQIAQMIKGKETEIKEMELELKNAKLEYEKAKKQKQDGFVTAQLDGVVKKIGDISQQSGGVSEMDMEDMDMEDDYYGSSGEDDAFAIIEGEGGTEVVFELSEMELDKTNVGTTVMVMNYDSGAMSSAEITGIDNEPTSYKSDGYSHNPNSSTYNAHARLESSDGLSVGDWVVVTKTDSGEQKPSNSVYLPIHYVHKEDADHYIMKDVDGKLKKQYVKTGEILYGAYIEIKGGLDINDKICFPYGNDVKEGIKTRETDEVLYNEEMMY
ncbi:MAG: biotin/lipoyl-binding protein [Ruminococcus sp.]|nr:biotin/lipoyl-binding protein [Ruminococcus sp.]